MQTNRFSYFKTHDMSNIKIKRSLFLVFLILIFSGKSFAQARPQLFIVPLDDRVYIYHNENVPISNGFNIYRSDSPGGDFARINEQPVTPAVRADELRPMLGDRFLQVLAFYEAENASMLWMRMRSLPVENSIATALFPEAAQALGRLFIDEHAPVGSEVTYRVEFVDFMGRPTGKELTQSARLLPLTMVSPQIMDVENTGRTVTIHWYYAGAPVHQPDYVIQFYIYRINERTGQPERVTDAIVIRNNAADNHFISFESPVINTTETYFMTAVDFTGRESERSEEYIFELMDNVPPQPVAEVVSELDMDNNVVITWEPVSTPEVTGYNIYRGTDMSRAFTRLNTEPLEPNAFSWIDSTATGGLAYFYYITTVNAAGTESPQSSLVMEQVPDLLPPSMPHNFTALFNTETLQVELSWEKEAFSDNFKTFVIMRKRVDDGSEGAFSRLTFENITDTRYFDTGEAGTGFLEGTRYQYVLFSASKANNYSDTLSLFLEIPILTPPDPPAGLTAVNDNGFRANISWNASLSRNLDGYVLYRKSLEHEEDFIEIERTDISGRFYRDEQGLEHGNHYLYTVTAVDIAGNESEFATPDTLHFRNFNPPAALRNVQAAYNEEGVVIRWDRSGAADLAGYRVYRSNTPTGRFEPLHQELLSEPGFVDSQGTDSSWYRVRAVDTSGNESRAATPVRPVSMLNNN